MVIRSHESGVSSHCSDHTSRLAKDNHRFPASQLVNTRLSLSKVSHLKDKLYKTLGQTNLISFSIVEENIACAIYVR